MSLAVKRRKLSLKKSASSNSLNPPEKPKNTIISMFKQQNDKQTKAENEQTEESENEGDVMITNVIGLNTGSASTSGICDRNKQNQERDSAKKLSLFKKKRQKVKDTNDSESAADSDFDLRKPHRKIKARHCKLSKSLSVQDSCIQGRPYTLRKRNTVPIVEVSDSEIDNEQKTGKHVQVKTDNVETNGKDTEDVAIKEKKSAKCTTNDMVKSDVDAVKDTEDIDNNDKGSAKGTTNDVIVLPTTGNKGGYFGITEKRKLSDSAEKIKLSLKRSKSGKELRKKSGYSKAKEAVNLFSDNTQIKNDTNEDTLGGIINTAKQNFSGKTYSDKKQTLKKSELFHKETAEEECSINLVEVQDSKKTPATNVGSQLLMQKPSGSKEINVIDSESTSNSKDSNCKHMDNNKNSLVRSKANTKNNSKSKSGLKDKKKAQTAEIDIKDKGKTNHDDDDDDNIDASAADSEKTEYRVPYYLENFKTIMESVLDDEENARLFDDIDMKYITTFNELEEGSQKLYVRLFSRKLTWLPMSKVNYPEISDNIPDQVDILINAGLLHSGTELSDLKIVLQILSAPDLKALGKSFHINCQGMTKPRIIEELLKKGEKSSISSMFKGGSTGTMEKTILSRAKTYLGKVCRLDNRPRAVFIRILMLFSLYNTNFDEESGGGGQNQLFQMLMVNIGRVVYPSYRVNRDRLVFEDSAALARFEAALQFEMDIQALTEHGKWSLAYEMYKQAKEAGKHICRNEHYIKWDSDLPEFLRVYTAGSVYTRVDNLGVEILQRLKLYKEAVDLLEELIAQNLYCVQYRGHWYERLALNLEVHLKSVEKSMAVLKRGLLDPTVRTGRRLALYERARKICEAPKSKYADKINEFEHQNVLPTPEVHIEGIVMSDATTVDMKYKFVMQGDSDSVTLCAVEELVLEHYKQNGYPKGLHAEGSIVSNLFVLLFWDIMFMDVPNVFHGPFQSCPLDIATRDFYLSRQHHVDDRLNWLKSASVEELTTEVGQIWSEHEGKMCAGISWDKFSGPNTHQNLITCMGGRVLAGILERYVMDPRHTRSGFPDLTLWNTDTKQFKICEVKGPNDRLSYKQILWIDYLLKLGVDAEVCYVKAVGSKKLKPVLKN